jgi:acetate---CoA ligase (ADP-forming)
MTPNPSSESIPRDEAEARERAMLADPSLYQSEEILRDGRSIVVRAIHPDDKDRLREHFQGLSSESIYLRFMGIKRELSDADLKRLTEVDFHDHVGLVATLSDGSHERFIGVGRYIRKPATQRAEVAFAVLDEHQGRGIGSLLLEHLRRIAQAGRIEGFEAEVLSNNQRMLEVFAQSGFKVARAFDSGTVHVYFPIGETPESHATSLARERAAAARSIARLISPRSVAVIGASRAADKIGGAILANLIRDGFTGAIFPINPNATEIHGLSAYPKVSAIDQKIDLAVICVPAAGVETAVEHCIHAQVGNLVVVTSGFAEVSDEGLQLERRICSAVRAAGMRMVGPNCMGVMNTAPAVSLNATFAPVPPAQGNVAMFSQSGALGISMLDYAQARKLGISSFISAGNRADVSSNDCLAYWAQDPATSVIVLYLESFGNPVKFARIAPAVARLKPIVAVKAGRTTAGKRAASSHSAALANLDVAVEALFEQAGVIRTNTLQELFDVVALLSSSPLPTGPRVGVITNAGGPGILLADACEAQGLTLPKLADETLTALHAYLPVRSGFTNPIDMTAGASPEEYARTIELVGADSNIDSLVVIYIPPMLTRPDEIADAIARGAASVPVAKPVLSVFLSSARAPARIHSGARGTIPTYEFPENAALALAAAWRYARFKDRPQGTAVSLDAPALATIREVVSRALEGATAPRWLSQAEIATLLAAVGVEAAAAEEVAPADVSAAAARVGFPLVAKAIAPGIIHKTEVGGVIMDLNSAAEAEQAARTLQERMSTANTRLERVLLQRQVDGGIETLVGMTSDPTFGPLLVCGMGGVNAELQKDVAFRLPPVTDFDAAQMLTELRISRLFDGYRGTPPGDRAALIGVIMRISALAEAAPELSELDLNPIKVLAPGKGAIVIDARMRVKPLAPPPLG